MRESFVFYRSFYEAINDLDDDADKLAIFNALTDYALNGTEPKLTGALKGMFNLARPQIDKNNIRYENGKKGGRPTGKKNQTETKPKPNKTKPEPNVNVNVNDNVNDNDNDADKSGGDLSLLFSPLLDYLNSKASTKYKLTGENARLLGDLLEAGYTPDDVKAVIDKKCAEWLDSDKMRGYLRPSTLFGKKFAEYLAAPDPDGDEAKRTEADRDRLTRQLQAKSEELETVKESLDTLGAAPPGRRSEEYGRLKEQALSLESVMDHLRERLKQYEN